jgi:RNA polymerase sigma-70 factor (ECF subfamily)
MAGDPQSCTSPSLLVRLGRDPTDEAAWACFVGQYGPKIYGWCRQHGLQVADAEDVTQDVLARLAEKMRAFRYDPARSFRAWLSTLTRHACSDFLASRQRPGLGTGDSAVVRLLGSVEAREGLLHYLDQAFDQELLEEAKRRVRQRVKPHRWEAFRLTALEGLSGAEAAARLGLPVAHVFVAKSDVLRMLQEEARQLEGASGP